MSTRSSGRAPKPPQRLITIEEGHQLASRSDRVSFAQLGEQHAREVESRGGEEPTDEEVDEVSVVPSGPGSAAAHPTTEPRQKKTRVSKKWNTLYDLVLAQKGLQYELWFVQGQSTPVKQKWVNCLKELKTEEPHCRVFAKKTDSSIIAHYNDLVAKQSSENGEALRESGGGTAPDSSEDSESKKEMKIRLEKILTAIVDAKAAKQESAASKQKKADDVANTTYMGAVQVSQGNARCGPGARGTPFGEAVIADELAMANAQASRSTAPPAGRVSGGAPSSGRSSPTMAGAVSGGAPSSGGSSPGTADGAYHVPPLGNVLTKEMAAPSIVDLANDTGATPEQAARFLNAGFTYELLPRRKATAMMARVLQQKLFLLRGEMDVRDYIDGCHGQDFEVPGLDGLLLQKLCDHYGVSSASFYSCDDAYSYANGWLDAFTPSADKFDTQTERLAQILIPAPADTPPAPSNTGGAASADPIINLGPSREGNGGGGNRGRKTRKNENRLQEDGLEGFMEQHMEKAEKAAEKAAVWAKQADEAKEARSREWQQAQMDHERKLRQDEFEFQRQLRADERCEERAERLMEQHMEKAMKAAEKAAVRAMQADEAKEARSREWQQAQMDHDRKLRQDEFEFQRQLRADERREERAERQAERKQKLEVMKLQLQIALASSKGTSST